MKLKTGLVTGQSERGFCSAARTGHRVEVDVVRNDAALEIPEVDFYQVTLAHAKEVAGHAATKGPERVVHPFSDWPGGLHDLQIDDHFGGVISRDGRRNVRGSQENRCLYSANLRCCAD
ncbi:MAG TPA: hypothetical protein EYQ64_04700, partial [Gemmatimonadetes bacterium]|nr:hypothetical protein [Gemmatimonadota bacterium]